MKTCIDCGKEITRQANRCGSCACKKKLENPKNHPMFGVHRFGKDAPNYGKISFWRGKKRPNLAKRMTGELNQSKRIEVRKRLSFTSSGSKNAMYIDGRSTEAYPSEFNNLLREQIYSRDNYCCQECGFTNEEHRVYYKCRLPIHHIDYNKKNNTLTNLISLCTYCHSKTNHKRKHWEEYFKERMQICQVV